MRNVLAALVAWTMVLVLPAMRDRDAIHAQQPQGAPPIFRGGANVVRLDVSVLDAARKPIHGLKADDFTILENGKPQPVVAMSEESVPDGPARLPVWSRAFTPDVASNDVLEQRLFAIVLDGIGSTDGSLRTGQSRPMNNPPMARAMREIVEQIFTRLRPGDAVAVAGGGCFQPFTSDPDALERVLDSLRPAAPPCPARFTHADPGAPHALVRDVAKYLAAAPQPRKIVVYIGPGVNVDEGWAANGADDVSDAVKSARGSNVHIYTISLSDFFVGEESPRVKMGRLASLRDLARGTGGVAMMDLGKYPDGLDQLFAENNSYYILGYRANQGVPGSGRDISVRLVNRDDVLVRARNTLGRVPLPPPDGSAPAARFSKDLAFDLEGMLPNLDVTFQTEVIPFTRATAGKTGVAVVTDIAEPVLPGAVRVAQRMSVRTIVYDERGSVSAQTTQQAIIDVAPAFDDRVHYRVLSRFDLIPGVYKVRVVAQNPVTGKLANMETEITAPDFVEQPISLSGVAITAPSEPAPPVPTFGTVAPVLADPPLVSRSFPATAQIHAAMRVYQGGTAGLEPVSVKATLVDATGATLVDRCDTVAAEKFDAERGADYQLGLPFDALELKPGEYLLTFQATLGNRHTPKRDVRLIVR